MGDKPTFVLLAAPGGTSYGVVKAIHAMGMRAELICDCRSSIRLSRFGETLYASRDLNAEPPQRIVDIINERHRQSPVELVLASGVPGTIVLNEIRDRLSPPTLPSADSATLQLLDNKWRFNQLCREIGVGAPKSIFFESAKSVNLSSIERELGYPIVIKPVDQCGGEGMIAADCADVITAHVLSNPHYRYGASGLIAQRYVPGRDWGYGAFALNGTVKVATAFLCGANFSAEFRTVPDLLADARQIIEHTRYTGIINFDCRFDENSRTFQFLECNPRFFRRVTAARLCGLNFIEAATRGETATPEGTSYFPIGRLFSREGATCLARGRWPLSALARDVIETFTDPIPAMLRDASWAPRLQSALAPLLQRATLSAYREREP